MCERGSELTQRFPKGDHDGYNLSTMIYACSIKMESEELKTKIPHQYESPTDFSALEGYNLTTDKHGSQNPICDKNGEGQSYPVAITR